MGTDNPVSYNQAAVSAIEPAFALGNKLEGEQLTKQMLEGLLINGTNVLAIEVHNADIGSSDLSSSTFFSVGINDNTSSYGELPDWFETPFVFSSSALPIVVINTNNQGIYDDPRIIADMGIIDNETVNHITDPFNNYSGKIGIEIRGESSQGFEKKSYTVETQDANGNNANVSLLGLPPENDWILYAPYTDKTLMRNVITYEWGRKLGMYASRVRYVELVIDDDYRGVYVLLEKIKRDKNRVDISKLASTDIAGDDLTGGYLLRVDKLDQNDYPAWTSMPSPKLAGEDYINFQFHDPKGEELVSVQQNYIKSFVKQFESVLSNTTFTDATNGYRKYIDIPSFVNFMIMNELGKNVDGYVYSTYMYKDKDSKDSKLHMGPLWDFNLAYGNVNYNTNSQYAPGWTYSEHYRMYWFRRLMQDPYFSNKMKCRWTELRSSIFTNAKMMNTIDSIAIALDEPQKRNFMRWPILDTYIWPNQYFDTNGTYQEEIDFLKQWIMARLTWMDNNMPGSGNCSQNPVTGVEPDSENSLMVYPNPSNGIFYFEIPGTKQNQHTIKVYNAVGDCIFASENVTGDTILWNGKDKNGINVSAGLYIVVIQSSGQEFTARIIKE
jgi:hypothetical protein